MSNFFVYCYDEDKKLINKKLRLLKENNEKQEFIFILDNPSMTFDNVGKVHISNKLNF